MKAAGEYGLRRIRPRGPSPGRTGTVPDASPRQERGSPVDNVNALVARGEARKVVLQKICNKEQVVEAVRAQDVVVAAGMFALRGSEAPQSELARALDIPRSRVSESIRRLEQNGLYSKSLGSLRSARLIEFLVQGVPWMFPARPGDVVSGVPTSHSGPVLDVLIASSQPYVWPSEDGDAVGRAVEPIHRHVLRAAAALPAAYKMLSLIDGIRVGRVREKHLAAEALEGMIRS